jgi:RHS repeat-associated protein
VVGGSTNWYGYDGGGSVRLLADATGSVTDTYTYDAFGMLIGSTGSTANAYLCRGEQWDSDVSLYYLRARWYAPTLGRFLTADSYEGEEDDPISLNAYGYAGGDPVGFDDPSGYSRGLTFEGLKDAWNLSLGWFRAQMARVVPNPVFRKATQLAWDISCCLVKVWSLIDLLGQEIAPGVDPALRVLDAGCRLACGDLSPILEIGTQAMSEPAQPARTKRVPSKRLRKEWQEYYQTEWPMDPDTGRPKIAHHTRPLADGGTNHPSNIEPMTRRQHVEHHRRNGDYRRWGKRACRR